MPFQFVFKVNNNETFSCKLQSLQCEANNKNGTRCQRRVVIGCPYCYVHLKYLKHLVIKPSLLHNGGKGLFASGKDNNIVFRKSQAIIEYTGEVINNQTLQNRYGQYNAPYTLRVGNNRCIDSACQRGVGSIANTNAGNNNAKFAVHNGRARLVATKNIRNGNELYVSYGHSYRLNEPTTEHFTKYVRK